ncbi:phospholipase/carboxylesterase family protein [Hypoxylon argillaceum]|nr:phospholipase/carboxylesterase family protein [Hypoxylon argillaceum]KAI1147747.1 phospholipase/carboxylesterase family protein [Nemania diffusa]
MTLGSVTLPAEKSHSHTVIFLHGRGSSARALSEKLWEMLDSRNGSLHIRFPYVKWVFPQAEEVHIERTDHMAKEWFDIWDARNPDQRRELQAPGLKTAIPKLVALIQREAVSVGLENIILAGTSQGCATAVQVLLNYPKPEGSEGGTRLGGFIGMSGWMSFAGKSVQESRELLGLEVQGGPAASDEIYRNTPVLITHSADDSIVPLKEGERLRDSLLKYGTKIVYWVEYPNGGHWISGQKGVDDLVTFLVKLGLHKV